MVKYNDGESYPRIFLEGAFVINKHTTKYLKKGQWRIDASSMV